MNTLKLNLSDVNRSQSALVIKEDMFILKQVSFTLKNDGRLEV